MSPESKIDQLRTVVDFFMEECYATTIELQLHRGMAEQLRQKLDRADTGLKEAAKAVSDADAAHASLARIFRKVTELWPELPRVDTGSADVDLFCALLEGLKDSEEDAPKPRSAETRCPSCEHSINMHQEDGCWQTVVTGKNGSGIVCPCAVRRSSLFTGMNPDLVESIGRAVNEPETRVHRGGRPIRQLPACGDLDCQHASDGGNHPIEGKA